MCGLLGCGPNLCAVSSDKAELCYDCARDGCHDEGGDMTLALSCSFIVKCHQACEIRTYVFMDDPPELEAPR